MDVLPPPIDSGEEVTENRTGFAGSTRARLARLGRRFGRMVLLAVLLLVCGIVLIAQSGRGQELALHAALSRIRAGLAGELVIGGIRSGSLWTGATLTGVRMDAKGGRDFLRADSVVVRYSLLPLLVGGAPLRSTTLWGADFELSQFTPDEAMNLTRLLVGTAPESSSGPMSQPVALGRLAVREGRVRILTPATPGTDPVVFGPDGEALRRFTFGDLDLDLEDAVFVPGAPISFEARLGSFSSNISIRPKPLVVREAFGQVMFGAQGIRIVDAAFRLPGTLLRGDLTVGPRRPGEGWAVRVQVKADQWGDLNDLTWVDPRIPDGRFRGGAGITVERTAVVDFNRFEIELEASQLVADGRVEFGEVLSMESVEVTVSPVTLDRLEPWLQINFPLDGWFSGTATFSGTLEDLSTTGRVTLVPTGFGGNPTTADFSGTIHRGDNPGATGFEARVDPVNYGVLESLWPGLPWAGTGSGRMEFEGRAREGIAVVAELIHDSDSALTSRTDFRGLVRHGGEEGGWVTDLVGEVQPLSVGLLSSLAPSLGLQGTLSGPLRIEGTLRELNVLADLEAAAGRMFVEGTVNIEAPASSYHLLIESDSLSLTSLSSRLPERTAWSGRLELEGTGLTVDSIEATARVVARKSRVGAVLVDTITAKMHVSGGVLTTDSLAANIGGITATGSGSLGLVAGRGGTSRIEFRAPSPVGLRPLLMGLSDSVLVQDGFDQLELEFLRLDGIDPDTLPTPRDVRLEGELAGSLSLSGDIRDFSLGAVVEIIDGRYKQNEADTIRLGLVADGLPASTRSWQLGTSLRGIVWADRAFHQGGFEAAMVDQVGQWRIELVRRSGEEYRAAGAFAGDSSTGEIDLTDVALQMDDHEWTLRRPGRIAWDDATLVVDSVHLVRAADDPMSFVADGTLARGGDSDFHVTVGGLHLARFLHMAQLGQLAIAGELDLDLTVHGPAETPSIESSFRIEEPRYGTMRLSRLEGSLDYADLVTTVQLDGWDGARVAVRASGTLPVDLSLAGVQERVLDAPMAIEISTDSLGAAIALSYVTWLEDIVGLVSGDLRIGGTPDAPEPDGLITVRDAAWSIEAIGVRHTAVNGGLRFFPDRTVEVSLVSSGVGSSDVSGTILLEPFRDPVLDLTFAFVGFPAVDRADIEGLITGSLALGGSYFRPFAEGALILDQGAIYVDEFRRAADVVDLSDPFLFGSGIAVDTTALIAQPFLTGIENPFFDNLRVNIDLSVPGDTWLRSEETNVEMSGDLLVRYDRSVGDFVLIGELEAVRGSHVVLGRTFDLDGGAVSFSGRPGLNPDLSIQASSRIRRPDDPPLDIVADLGGTLVQPIVTLSTSEAGLAQSDLVSYLIFGQLSSAPGSNQVRRGLVTYLGGALANRVGSAVLGGVADYVAVQQGGRIQALGQGAQTRGLFRGTHIELGRYVGDDVFVVVVFSPFGSDSGSEQNPIAGVRVEVALTDEINVEGFLEDRFLRSGSAALGASGLLDSQQILGVFVFRDWGFSPNRDP